MQPIHATLAHLVIAIAIAASLGLAACSSAPSETRNDPGNCVLGQSRLDECKLK